MTYKIPLNILSIHDDGFHLCLEAGIVDQPVQLLVDTGASRTVFDLQYITSLLQLSDHEIEQNTGPSGGIGTTNLESSLATIPSLNLGGLIIKDYRTALIDMIQVNALFGMVGHRPVYGILGGDILLASQAIINYPLKQLTLFSSKRRKRGFYLEELNG